MSSTRAAAVVLLALSVAAAPVWAEPDPARILTGLWDGRVDIHTTWWPGPDCRLFFYRVSPVLNSRWTGKMLYLSPRLRQVIDVEGDAFDSVVTVRFRAWSVAMVRLDVTPVRKKPMLIGSFRYNEGKPNGFPVYLSKMDPGAGAERPGFLGTWIGAWENRAGERLIDMALVVEKMDGASAKTVYLWGSAPQLGVNAPGQFQVTGALEGDDTLRLVLPNGAQVTYRLSPDEQKLAGEHSRDGRVTRGVLERAPR